jgi:hypothetical protein
VGVTDPRRDHVGNQIHRRKDPEATNARMGILPRHVIFALITSADRAVPRPSAGDSVRNFRAEVISPGVIGCRGMAAE